ncbi:hypothetical protein KD576_004205 [Salmonella enterica subsp. enterica serovar Thompson]|nr:hypothetical protein [Salmonella enterica]EHP7123063.1 hypothetical protein [Salmonella enterica subsp. enterica serovar Thompson]EHP7219069.1 hypothetical protein [Salmonella enterica subsp. enterica serovar Thompson]HAF3525083.1 hypothetical protein [Salmonella enterica]HAF6964917.1 hypothetical protein [Salmonella enterica]
MKLKTFTELRNEFRGHWREILEYYGVSLPPQNKKRGACPLCGCGEDRFNFADQGIGRWFCDYHEPPQGDGFDLLRLAKGWDMPTLRKNLNDYSGYLPSLPVQSAPVLQPAEPSPEERRAEFEQHYQRIREHVTWDNCAYLAHKGYPTQGGWQLISDVILPLADDKKMVLKKGGTLLKLVNFDGEMVGLQCIYFNGHEWVKRIIAGSAKKGAFHALDELIPGRPFVLCEGYATAYALKSFLPRSNIIMAVDAGNLLFVAQTLIERFPDAVLVVAGDNDKSGAGMIGAMKVRAQLPDTGISIPLVEDTDWDDAYRKKGAIAARKEFVDQLKAFDTNGRY